MTTISVRVEDKVKKEASSLFNELGLDLSTAINLFLRKALSCQGIPFDVRKEIPNKETIASFNEGKLIEEGKIKAKSYHSAKELFDDLDK